MELHPWMQRSERMAGYTKVNLKEIEDSAGDRSPEIEMRFARSHLDSEHLGVSYFRYGPGYHSTMGHSHREQEEAYLVVSGSGRIKLDDDIVDLRPWDVVRSLRPRSVRSRQALTASRSSRSDPIARK